MTKETIYFQFRKLGYSDQRAKELTEMFLLFTEGYSFDPLNIDLDLCV